MLEANQVKLYFLHNNVLVQLLKKKLQKMLHVRMKPINAIFKSFNHCYSYNILSKRLKEEINNGSKGQLPFLDNDLLIIFIDIN